MRRWISILLPFVGLALFVVIVWGTGPENILSVLRTVDTGLLVYIPLILAVLVLVRGLRWWYLMRMIGIDFSLARSCTVWAIGFFASAVTPGKVGDAVRAVYVQNETDATFGQAFLTVFMDRLWDLLAVLGTGIVTLLLVSHLYIEIPSVWVMVVGAAAFIVAVYFIMNKALVQRVLRPVFDVLVPERFKGRLAMNFHSFYDSLNVYWRSPRRLAAIVAMTACYWVAVFGMAYYVTRLLGIGVSLGYMILIMPTVTLVELVPISVSGLGTRDATVMYFFSLVGIAGAQAVGFSIAYVLIGTYLLALVGFAFWLRNPVGLGSGR